MQMEIAPPHLTYLPRLQTYADTLQEYKFRRAIFDEEGIEVPLEIIREYHRTFDHFPLKAYITEMKEQHKNSGLISRKADELYLQVLEDE